MPYLKIQSNQALETNAANSFIEKASALVAEKLGKPERYVMVAIDPPVPMLFAGTDDPAVFMELKSIGLSESQTPELSGALCELAHDTLGVNQDRVYIEFADAPRKMWGWNGATF
ncbi:MAG: phenylpyruvate tautomerase MIF-related protein [Thioalkalispiraceae bacterium]|jgi:phenylpyruvate tautomerase PptA (4-oxalocrotonate tautomerase family)